MAQWLRALDNLAEDLGSVLSTHMVAHDGLYLQFQFSVVLYTHATEIHVGKLLVHFFKKRERGRNAGQDVKKRTLTGC